MATAIDNQLAATLLATTRTRGGYVDSLNAFLASDDAAWDVTEDYVGKKLQSCKVGFSNAIEKSGKKEVVRVVLNSDKLYLIKL